VNLLLKNSSAQDVRLGFERPQPLASMPAPTHGFPAFRGYSRAQSTNRPCSTSENPGATSFPEHGQERTPNLEPIHLPRFCLLADAFQEGSDRFKLRATNVDRVCLFSHWPIIGVIAKIVNRFLVFDFGDLPCVQVRQVCGSILGQSSISLKSPFRSFGDPKPPDSDGLRHSAPFDGQNQAG